MSEISRADSAPLTCGTKRLGYFVPFYLNSVSPAQAAQALAGRAFTRPNGKKSQLWIPCPFPLDRNPDIYEHIQSLMQTGKENPGQDSAVCRTFRYNTDHMKLYLEDYGKQPFTFIGRGGQEVPLSINSIFIHLFTTGIGFLSYDAVVPGIMRADRLFSFQEQFKELCLSTRNRVVRFILRCPSVPADQASSLEEAEALGRPGFLPKDSESLSEYSEIKQKYEIRFRVTRRLGDLIRLLLESSCPDIRFFAGSEYNVPDKALLMSYVTFDGADQAVLRNAACRLARGYDEKYHISQDDLDACRELYDNMACYASTEGCCVAVSTSEDNHAFFVTNPPYKKYAFFYLLSLYQHYSLIRFSSRITSEFPSDPDQYLTQTAYAEKMEQLIAQINTHLMKSDFATVSYLPSHNRFYACCREALLIPQDRQSLMSGFEYLVRLQADMMRARREERHQKELEAQEALRLKQEERHRLETQAQEAKEAQLNWLITLLTIITFLGDGFAFVTALVALIQQWRHGPSFSSIAAPIGFGVLLVIVAVLYFKHVRSMKKRAKRSAGQTRDDRPAER